MISVVTVALMLIVPYLCNAQSPTPTPTRDVIEQFAPASLSPWSQPMGNPQHTGLSPLNGTNIGAFLWNFNAGAQVMSPPIVYDGLVIFASCTGSVTALNAATGLLVWNDQFEYGTSACNVQGAISWDGYFYIPTGGTASPYSVYLTNLVPATGAVLSSYPSPTGNEYGNVLATPQGHIVIGDTDGCTRLWYGDIGGDTGSGSYWCFGTPGYPMAAPSASLDGSVLFIGGRGNSEPDADPSVYAVFTAAGRGMWRFTPAAGYTATTSPLVTPWGSVIAGYTNGVMYALSAATGSLLWTFNSGTASIPCWPALGADGMSVLAGCNNLYSLNGSTGAVLWNTSFRADDDGVVPPVSQAPTVSADGIVYAPVDIYVYGLDGASGAHLWAFAASGTVSTSVSIGTNGIIYFGSIDAHVYALHGYVASPTPTVTGTSLPTATAAVTPSSTSSPSASFTAVPTGTGSFTHWQSYTRTATQSMAPTRTPTRTPTATRTATHSPSPTKTATRSASAPASAAEKPKL